MWTLWTAAWARVRQRAAVGESWAALRSAWPWYPVSAALGLSTLAMTLAFSGPGRWHLTANALAGYHAGDLAEGKWFRLPLSALLAQSWWQLAWTLLMALTLFAALEALIGSLRTALILGASHILPTLAVAGWATWTASSHLLSVADWGTSCLFMGAAGALAAHLRSRVLSVIIVLVFCGDVFINTPVTICEHLMSVLLAVVLVRVSERPVEVTLVGIVDQTA